MGQPSYPNSENLEDYFDSINVIDEGIRKETYALMRLDLKALAAKAAWENLTDWTPWLKDSADVTRYYDPPTMGGGRGRDLWLGAGLLSITELRTGISPTSTGSVLVLNQDYRLWPYNAAIEGKPYEMIEFAWSHHGLPRSVSVTGKFGYSETIPDDAWDAILKYGAYLAYQELALAVSESRPR